MSIASLSPRKVLPLLLALFWLPAVSAQSKAGADPGAVSEDVTRFWDAYDRVRDIADPVQRTRLLQDLYIEPGSPGLKAFLEVKGCTGGKIRRPAATLSAFLGQRAIPFFVRRFPHRDAATGTGEVPGAVSADAPRVDLLRRRLHDLGRDHAG